MTRKPCTKAIVRFFGRLHQEISNLLQKGIVLLSCSCGLLPMSEDRWIMSRKTWPASN